MIPKEFFDTLYESMPRRIEACYQAKNGNNLKRIYARESDSTNVWMQYQLHAQLHEKCLCIMVGCGVKNYWLISKS
jgi:hypothetical protein